HARRQRPADQTLCRLVLELLALQRLLRLLGLGLGAGKLGGGEALALELALLALQRLAPHALINEFAVDARDVLRAAGQPALRGGEGQSHEQRVVARIGWRLPPLAAIGLERTAPGEKFTLGLHPDAQLVPAPEDRLVRDLGVGFFVLARHRDQEAVGVVGELADELPFQGREFGTQRPPPRRLALLPHARAPERQHAAQPPLPLPLL